MSSRFEPRRHTTFPKSAGLPDGKHGGEADLRPSTLLEWGKGRVKREGPFETAGDSDGSVHCHPEWWRRVGGAALLTLPPTQWHRQDYRCHKDWIRGGVLPTSENRSLQVEVPLISTSLARTLMGSHDQPASSNLKSVEEAMAPMEEGRKRWQSAEGSPLLHWERSAAQKIPDRREWARSGEDCFFKFGSRGLNF